MDDTPRRHADTGPSQAVETFVSGPYKVHHCRSIDEPHLLVLRDGDLAGPCEDPSSFPEVAAVQALRPDYDWDDAGYREACRAMGFDPDRLRPQRFVTYEAAKSLTGRRFLAMPDAADPNRDAVLDGLAFESHHTGTFDPFRLSEAFQRNLARPASEVVLDDVRRAWRLIDWERASAYAAMKWLASPFAYDHEASVSMGGRLFAGKDGLQSISPEPEILAPVPAGDLVRRRAALVTERHTMALVLSEEEMFRFERGGDRDYWLTAMDWYATPERKAAVEARGCDLSMTHRILDEMVRVAYAHHRDRLLGNPLDPDASLSCETRQPIPMSSVSSSERPPVLPDAPDAVAQPWLKRLLGAWKRPPLDVTSPTRIMLPWGPVLALRLESGAVLVGTHADFPLDFEGRQVRFEALLQHAFGTRCLPRIDDPSFMMADLATGEPLGTEEALRILGEACAACGTMTGPSRQGHGFPMSVQVRAAA